MWADGRILLTVELVMHRANEVELIAAVTHTRDACGEIDGSPLHLFVVCMHVPKTRHGELARCVQQCRIYGNLNFAARTYCGDHAICDHDDGVLHCGRTRSVLKGCADDGELFRLRHACDRV